MDLQQLWLALQAIVAAAWAMPEVQLIVYHSLVNFVAGVAASLATNTFDPGKLWEFFGKKIIPFVALYFVSRLAGEVVLGGVLPSTILVAIEAALVKDLVDSLSRIPGLEDVINKLPGPVLRALTKDG